MNSAIEQEGAAMGCFPIVQCRKRIVIGYCGGSWLYANPIIGQDMASRFAEVAMSMSVEEIQKGAVNVKNDLKDINLMMHHTGIIPAWAIIVYLQLILPSTWAVNGFRGLSETRTDDHLLSICTKSNSKEIFRLQVRGYSICFRKILDVEYESNYSKIKNFYLNLEVQFEYWQKGSQKTYIKLQFWFYTMIL